MKWTFPLAVLAIVAVLVYEPPCNGCSKIEVTDSDNVRVLMYGQNSGGERTLNSNPENVLGKTDEILEQVQTQNEVILKDIGAVAQDAE